MVQCIFVTQTEGDSNGTERALAKTLGRVSSGPSEVGAASSTRGCLSCHATYNYESIATFKSIETARKRICEIRT